MAQQNDEQIVSDADDNVTLLDLDSINDIDMNEVEAAPEFLQQPPAGTYALSVTAKMAKTKFHNDETDKDEERVGIRFIYKIMEPPVLEDKAELIPSIGDMISENFQVTKEGLRYFKTRAGGILGDLGKAKLGEVIAALNNDSGIFYAKVGTRESKGKNGKTYYNANVQIKKKDQDPAL